MPSWPISGGAQVLAGRSRSQACPWEPPREAWVRLTQEGIHWPLPPGGVTSDQECHACDQRTSGGTGDMPLPPSPQTCSLHHELPCSATWAPPPDQGRRPSDHGGEKHADSCRALCSLAQLSWLTCPRLRESPALPSTEGCPPPRCGSLSVPSPAV